MKKPWKPLIITGVVTLAIGVLGIFVGIFESFGSIRINGNAGVGAVGAGLPFLLIGSVAAVAGGLLTLVGSILLIVSRHSDRNSQS